VDKTLGVDLAKPSPSNTRDVSNLLAVVVALAVLALLSLALLSGRQERPQPGDPAPPFSLSLFDGPTVSLSDLKDQVVVLNFWASWCAPCRREAGELQHAWEAYRERGVVFLGITYKDTPSASLRFIQEMGITFPSGADEKGRISRAYAITGVPETFVIDRDGRVAWFHIGELETGALAEQLDALLAP